MIFDLINKVKMIFTRGLINTVDDANPIQLLQCTLLSDETKSKIERIQNYGFSSVPLAEGETLIGAFNGDKGQCIVIIADSSANRPVGQDPGTVCIWHHTGHKITLTDDGIDISLDNDKPLNVVAKNVNINLQSGGQFSVAGSNLTVDA